jgi:hypothetical protein
MGESLRDLRTSWWAKHAHAHTHIAHLRTACEEYRERRPVEVRAEDTDVPGEVAYRFHQLEPVPLGISLIVGDVLHNLRSALDSLMLGMVRLDLDRALSEDEERACQFPISVDPQTFENDLRRAESKGMVSERLRGSLREAQPFWLLELSKAKGVENAVALTYEHEAKFNGLMALNRLSNIDKHRRVNVAAWWPSLTYWMGDAASGLPDWHPNPPPYADGQIVGVMRGAPEGPPPEAIHDFELTLPEAPYHDPRRYYTSHPLADEAANWHFSVGVAMQTVIRAYGRIGQ